MDNTTLYIIFIISCYWISCILYMAAGIGKELYSTLIHENFNNRNKELTIKLMVLAIVAASPVVSPIHLILSFIHVVKRLKK